MRHRGAQHSTICCTGHCAVGHGLIEHLQHDKWGLVAVCVKQALQLVHALEIFFNVGERLLAHLRAGIASINFNRTFVPGSTINLLRKSILDPLVRTTRAGSAWLVKITHTQRP